MSAGAAVAAVNKIMVVAEVAQAGMAAVQGPALEAPVGEEAFTMVLVAM
jgi:hypothetical protein